MGNGTSSGMQTPKQRGVVVREGENFPVIPEHLLKLTSDQLQERIEHVVRLHRFNAESMFPDLQFARRLEDTQVVLEFAKTAVERKTQTVQREIEK